MRRTKKKPIAIKKKGKKEKATKAAMSALNTEGKSSLKVKRKNHNEIKGIIAAAAAAFLILSYLPGNMTGVIGNIAAKLVFGLFGTSAYAIPPVLIILSLVMFIAKERSVNGYKYLQMLVLLSLFSVLFYISGSSTGGPVEIRNGIIKILVGFYENGVNPPSHDLLKSGGIIGGIIGTPLNLLLKSTGTILVAVSLMIVDIMLLTEVSLKSIFTSVKEKKSPDASATEKNIFSSAKDKKVLDESTTEGELPGTDKAVLRRNKNYFFNIGNAGDLSGNPSGENNLNHGVIDEYNQNNPEFTEERKGFFRRRNRKRIPDFNLIGFDTEANRINELADDIRNHTFEKNEEAEENEETEETKKAVKTENVRITEKTEKTDKFDKSQKAENTRENSETEATGKEIFGDATQISKRKLNSNGSSRKGDNKDEGLYTYNDKDALADEEPVKYTYPPLNLLKADSESARTGKAKNQAVDGARKLEETLKSFGIEAKVINVSRGPSVTRYELQPSAGVKVSRIVNLSDDIALNLAAHGVRMEAPIPGKAAIGIEIPNNDITPVFLRDVLESDEFKKHPSKVVVSLGKDIAGECIVTDIAKMPHLLIAGSTGSGKSVCLNCIIASILFNATPDEVKLIMIDPKVVELVMYNGIPHLLIPVVTDPRKAAGALNWTVQEMINRYKLFADAGVRDLSGYNAFISKTDISGKLPQIVIIIDELADLMMVAPNDVEDAICRLAQMARAAGMHLVVATQRPSVDVITGLIKANIPSRIAFAVSSQVDSRTILDMGGAEKLLGRGDMLFHPVGRSKPVRVQGAYVSDSDIEKLVDFIKNNSQTQYDNNVIEEINKNDKTEESGDEDYDELLTRAIDLIMESGQASVSMIQRRLKVGYSRAGRIMDQLEERGIVGASEGSKPRQILLTRHEWQEMQMDRQ